MQNYIIQTEGILEVKKFITSCIIFIWLIDIFYLLFAMAVLFFSKVNFIVQLINFLKYFNWTMLIGIIAQICFIIFLLFSALMQKYFVLLYYNNIDIYINNKIKNIMTWSKNMIFFKLLLSKHSDEYGIIRKLKYTFAFQLLVCFVNFLFIIPLFLMLQHF